MTREEINDLAAIYALGGLDGEDRVRFESLLRSGDPDATAALRDFEETLTGLAGRLSESPPPSVKAALMARVAADARARLASVEPSPGKATPVVLPFPERPRRLLWPAVWAGLMAAGLAAIVAGLAVSSAYEKRLDALAREAAEVREQLGRQQQVIAILRDPATQVVALAGLEPSPGAKGRMMWHATAGGLFVAAGLPPAPEGKTYQLWAITGQGPPVSAGVFAVDPSGTGGLRVPPLSGVSRVDVFAVTIEPTGGLPAPSGAMYLAGKS